MPCAYFVLLKIVSIPSDCVFKIDAQGKFKSLSEAVSMHNEQLVPVSMHNGELVLGISQGEEHIPILCGWTSERVDIGKNYAVRLTKNINLRWRISCEFLVRF